MRLGWTGLKHMEGATGVFFLLVKKKKLTIIRCFVINFVIPFSERSLLNGLCLFLFLFSFFLDIGTDI